MGHVGGLDVARQVPKDGGQNRWCHSVKFENDTVHVAGPVNVLLLSLGLAQVVYHFHDFLRNPTLLAISLFLARSVAVAVVADVVGNRRLPDGPRVGIDQPVQERGNRGGQALDARPDDRRGDHVGRIVLLDGHDGRRCGTLGRSFPAPLGSFIGVVVPAAALCSLLLLQDQNPGSLPDAHQELVQYGNGEDGGLEKLLDARGECLLAEIKDFGGMLVPDGLQEGPEEFRQDLECLLVDIVLCFRFGGFNSFLLGDGGGGCAAAATAVAGGTAPRARTPRQRHLLAVIARARIVAAIAVVAANILLLCASVLVVIVIVFLGKVDQQDGNLDLGQELEDAVILIKVDAVCCGTTGVALDDATAGRIAAATTIARGGHRTDVVAKIGQLPNGLLENIEGFQLVPGSLRRVDRKELHAGRHRVQADFLVAVVDELRQGLAEGGQSWVVLWVVGLDVLVVPEAAQNGPQSFRQVLLCIDGWMDGFICLFTDGWIVCVCLFVILVVVERW